MAVAGEAVRATLATSSQLCQAQHWHFLLRIDKAHTTILNTQMGNTRFFPAVTSYTFFYHKTNEQEEKRERAQNDVFWASSLHLKLMIVSLTYAGSVGKCNHDPKCCSTLGIREHY
jgi:hypothetical protein